MASGFILSCPVCSEDYTTEGEHVAKILPCMHTVCWHCVSKKLYRYLDESLNCPICNRDHHFDEGGIQSISDNPYISMLLKTCRQEICPLHTKRLCLFCNELACQKAICPLCLENEHKDHDFDELEAAKQKRRTEIRKDVDKTKTNLKFSKELLVALKTTNDLKNRACEDQIKQQKDQAIKILTERFEKLVKDVQERKMKIDESVDRALAETESNLLTVAKLEGTIDDEATCEELSDKLNIVRNLAVSPLKVQLHKYFVFKTSKLTETRIINVLGHLTEEQFQLKVDSGETATKKQCVEDTAKIRKSTDFKCTVTKSFPTNFQDIRSMCLLADNSIVVCGREHCYDQIGHVWKLSLFNLNEIKVVPTAVLSSDEPKGMCVVTMNYQEHLAVAYGGKVDFHNVHNLGTVVLCHIPERQAWCIGNVCTGTKTTFMYTYFPCQTYGQLGDSAVVYQTSGRPVDTAVMHQTSGGPVDAAVMHQTSGKPVDAAVMHLTSGKQTNATMVQRTSSEPVSVAMELFWLDCTASPPKISLLTEITSCDVANATAMCCVYHEDKLLLVVAENLRLRAYNVQNGNAEWIVKGNLLDQNALQSKSLSVPASGSKVMSFTDVTVNRNGGNLFACDRPNHSIHVISFRGEYLALFHIARMSLLCEPWFACWSEETTSLVVANNTGCNSKQHISVMNIK